MLLAGLGQPTRFAHEGSSPTLICSTLRLGGRADSVGMFHFACNIAAAPSSTTNDSRALTNSTLRRLDHSEFVTRRETATRTSSAAIMNTGKPDCLHRPFT